MCRWMSAIVFGFLVSINVSKTADRGDLRVGDRQWTQSSLGPLKRGLLRGADSIPTWPCAPGCRRRPPASRFAGCGRCPGNGFCESRPPSSSIRRSLRSVCEGVGSSRIRDCSECGRPAPESSGFQHSHRRVNDFRDFRWKQSSVSPLRGPKTPKRRDNTTHP